MTLAEYLPVVDDLRSRGKPSASEVYRQLTVVVDRARTIAAAVAAYETRRAQKIAVPYDEVLATVRAMEVDPLPTTGVSLLATVIADVDYPLALAGHLRDVEQSLYSLVLLRRLFASQTTPTAGVSNVFQPTAAPLVPYRVKQGDTLERLALATLGSVDRAIDIVILNGLDYPYLEATRDYVPVEFASDAFDPDDFATAGGVDRAGVPAGVRVTGELLWLPSDAVVGMGDLVTDRDVELWGRDLQLADGYLAVTDDGDVRTVEGRDNIVQALGQRIGTGRGELVLHPAYGIERMLAVGIEGTYANTVLSGLEVAKTVKQDPRVTNVRNLEVLFQGTANRAEMRVGLIGAADATLPLNLVIPESSQG